ERGHECDGHLRIETSSPFLRLARRGHNDLLVLGRKGIELCLVHYDDDGRAEVIRKGEVLRHFVVLRVPDCIRGIFRAVDNPRFEAEVKITESHRSCGCTEAVDWVDDTRKG